MNNIGMIYVVGIGPGGPEQITPQAHQALLISDLIIGYTTYIDLIKNLFPDHEFISSGMTQEVERCRIALERAVSGKKVALISSGDSGIYGMAGIMLEVAGATAIPVEIIPGVTAASAAAAVLGAPLMNDFAVISLSDRLTPWNKIAQRLESAAAGDFVICLYNPRSNTRHEQFSQAREILRKFRPGSTPVGIVKNAGRWDETHLITTLDQIPEDEVNMFCVVIVGNSRTYVANGRMITARGYDLKFEV